MHLITLVLVLLLGGATLLLQDPLFIYWKPTVVNWAFAIAFFGSQFIGQKNFLQRMLESQITLNEQRVWKNLNFAWVAFFIAMGGINLYVAFNFEENTWVNFKLFGMMGLTFVFVIAQSIYLARHIVPDDEDKTESIHDQPTKKQSSLDA
jgi:intracellular septation protein